MPAGGQTRRNVDTSSASHDSHRRLVGRGIDYQQIRCFARHDLRCRSDGQVRAPAARPIHDDGEDDCLQPIYDDVRLRRRKRRVTKVLGLVRLAQMTTGPRSFLARLGPWIRELDPFPTFVLFFRIEFRAITISFQDR
jgi:hypothetical protein